MRRGAAIMKAFTKVLGSTALAVFGMAAGAAFAPAAASAAATPTLPSLVAYVRAGDVYVSKGAAETRLTKDGGYNRPRWSPDGKQLALLKDGQLWTMKADGSAKRRLTTRAASGPSWSPDGKTIAFASLSCTGGPGVYRIAATATNAQPEVLFPSDCRGEALPAVAPVARATESADLNDRLRTDDAVAWSPDGTKIAFRGGNCESTYDACLSVGTVATGGERTVAAFGGGSLQTSGFAVVPSWRQDGAKLAWTAYQEGETTADNQAVHVVEWDAISGSKRSVGGTLDRELAYVDATRGVATTQNQGASWITVVALNGTTRTPFHAGSQPSVQPV